MNNYQEIVSKLVKFKRKYYKNRLLKGLLLALAGSLFFFILIAVLEYYGRFNPAVRTVLFYSFIGFCMFLLARYIAIPVIKLINSNSSMTNEEASLIIGKHFPEVEDKLINTLQLRDQALASSGNELLLASIDQKIKKIKPVPFSNAVNYKENSKYIKYLAIPLLLLGVIILFQSNIIKDSSERLIKHNQEFKNKAPFEFVLQNKDLNVLKNESYEVQLKLTGNSIPDEVYLNLDGNPIKMKKKSATSFLYTLNNVAKAHKFSFKSGEFFSDAYQLKLLPKPLLVKFSAQLNYPSYTGLKTKTIQNVGDLEVPQGTTIKWNFNTKEVSEIEMISNTKKLIPIVKGKNKFVFQNRYLRSSNYQIKLLNDYVKNPDSVSYGIQIVSDKYPVISMEERKDTTGLNNKYYFGKASDDYGISKITFNYTFKNSENSSIEVGKKYTKEISKGSGTDKSFYYYWDADGMGLLPADEVEYYFEVWDNDGVNGSKSTKSKLYTFAAPSKEELKEKKEENSKKVKSALASAQEKAAELQKKTQELKKELSSKKNLSWQEKKKVQNLLNEQKDLQKKLDLLQEENELNNKEQNQFKKPKEELLKKQQELKKLMEEVMTPEMKELYKKLEELLKKNNKEEIKKHLDKMKFDDKEMEKQLDRALEQMKQMEVEQKMDEAIDKLDELIDKQEQLAKQTEEKAINKEEIVKEQEKLKEEFVDLKKELEELEKLNKELESSMDLDTEKEMQSEVSEDMEDSKENASKGKNKKSSESQKSASEKMKKMKESLQKQKEDGQAQQNEEDYETLRGILENLVQLSFDQEDLLTEFKVLREYNPKYIELSQKQKKVIDDAKIIEDSLFALSKRNIAVQGFINKEIGKMNYHMESAMTNLKIRYTTRAVRDQQYAMTNMNNLAVMLSEALKQMQEQMKKDAEAKACKKPGSKPGKKPGKKSGKKPGSGMSGMKGKQQKLSKMLGEMKKMMDKGEMPSSEGFAKMAAEQEAMRRALQQLQKELSEEGKGGKLGDLKKTEKLMDEQEKDLVNKRITPETLKRNKEILTRLLEHERAEKEQETEDKREANEAEEKQRVTPPEIQEYLNKLKREQELLKAVPPNMSPYYKEKVKEYYRQLGS